MREIKRRGRGVERIKRGVERGTDEIKRDRSRETEGEMKDEETERGIINGIIVRCGQN